jgi:hypothetical protein
MNIPRSLLTLILAVTCSASYGGDVRVDTDSKYIYAVSLNGPIAKGDLNRLKAAFGRRLTPTKQAPSIVLDSPGGELSEAMAIGRWVRETKLRVLIRQNAKCFSSCVYILAAGQQKMVLGDIGIHRPYLLSVPSAGVEAAMRNALRKSRDYFENMNVPVQLADAMFSTPPEKLMILDESELSAYRLNQDDIAFSEERDLKSAAAYGMTRQEYMVKWAKFQAESEHCHELPETRDMLACLNPYLVNNGFRKPEGTR